MSDLCFHPEDGCRNFFIVASRNCHSLKYVTGTIEQIFLVRFGADIAVDMSTAPSDVVQAGMHLICVPDVPGSNSRWKTG
jgi:hypothetical protein